MKAPEEKGERPTAERDRASALGDRLPQLPEHWGSDDFVKWYLVAPTAFLLLFVTLYPVLMALYMSLHQWQATIPAKPFVGLANYANLVGDSRFIGALAVTAFFLIVSLTIEFVLGFSLALLFQESFPGKQLVITLLLIPIVIPRVITGFTARIGFHPEFGFVNQFLSFVAGHEVGIDWMGHPGNAQWMIIIADVWQWTPFVFILLYSGLVSLSREPYEAAVVDGASPWQVFKYVTLPRMRYIIVVTLLLRSIDLVKLFDKIMVTTAGGPGRVTETVSVFIYYLGFRFWDLGYAATVSFGLLIIVATIALFAVNRYVQQEG